LIECEAGESKVREKRQREGEMEMEMDSVRAVGSPDGNKMRGWD